MQFVHPGYVEQQQLVPQLGCELVMHVCEQARPIAAEIDQDAIDAIHAGARHQADIQIRFRHRSRD